MTPRKLQLAAITMSVLAGGAYAQTTYPEVEPNTNKAEATTAGTITLIAGDSITGTSTGAVATALSTLATSVDYFRVKTTAQPLGIYRHTLTITTTGTAGHTGTIRGLSQATGVINTLSDVAFQTNTTTPARTNTWYGFGKQEEIYYAISGAATTTAPYVTTLSTSSVTATAVPGTYLAGPITVSSVGLQTTDTEIYVYDSNLNPVLLGHNDDPLTFGGASTITVTIPSGTYYAAISNFNTSNNQSDLNPTEGFQSDNLLEFPNAMANNSTTTALAVSLSVSDGISTTPVTLTKANAFDIAWVTFTVTGIVGPPANDNCASATALTGATTVGNLATATNDGAASCDTGGAASKDVWYSYTAGPYGGTLSLDTCGSTGIDTVLSVYAACGGAELACSDDCGGAPCGGPTSCLSASLTPNQQVRIRVSDKGLGGASFIVHSSFLPNPPTNDSCTTPIVLAGPGLYPVDNSSATTGVEGQTEAACLFFTGTAIPKDVWYTYTPTTNGLVAVTTCGLIPVPPGPSTDSKIAIYAGAGCPTAGTAIACNDDAGNGVGSGTTCAAAGFNSYIEFPATCGVTNTIQIGMYWGSTSSILGQFSVTETGGTSCATPVTYYCKGDGTGAACPCGNTGAAGNGCANSLNANGGNIAASGNASIAADTWVLSSTGIPNGPGLYFQGTTQLGGGNGVVFGDGLRCTGGSVIRLGIVTAAANASTYPSPNPPAVNAIPISLKGLNVAGNVRNYQLWYRDSAVFCSAQVFNLTNAVNVTWTP